MSEVQTIAPEKLAELVKENGSIELIDVRTPAEFRELHATYARNIPLDSLDPQQVMSDRNGDSEKPLYFICQSATRGGQACKKFHHAGFTNVVNVEGGTKAWAERGLPVVRGKKAMSLERQVRILAGFLVVLGALLAFLINPGFIAISAFIGAGLMYAGITDSCGMAMMLSKMPWNQV